MSTLQYGIPPAVLLNRMDHVLHGLGFLAERLPDDLQQTGREYVSDALELVQQLRGAVQ